MPASHANRCPSWRESAGSRSNAVRRQGRDWSCGSRRESSGGSKMLTSVRRCSPCGGEHLRRGVIPFEAAAATMHALSTAGSTDRWPGRERPGGVEEEVPGERVRWIGGRRAARRGRKSVGIPPRSSRQDTGAGGGVRREVSKFVAGGVSRILSRSWSEGFRLQPGPRMIIYLGRRLPDASSDLPGSRDGSGRSVSGGRSRRRGKPHRRVGPFPLCPPIWSCSRWGLPSQAGHPACW